MNDDQSHFCSECGQRFSPSQPSSGFSSGGAPSSPAPQPGAQQSWQGLPPGFGQPGNPAMPPQPAPNHSPQVPPGFGAPQGITQDMFSPAPQSQPDFDSNHSIFGLAPVQPGGAPMPPQPASPPPPMPSLPPQQPMEDPLYSTPSVAPEVPPANYAEPSQRIDPPKRPKLHSPMLHNTSMLEAIDDDDQPRQPQDPQRRGGALRSPLLGGDDDAEPPAKQSKSRGGLRSPLLGSDSDDDEPPQSQSQGARGKGLRSPLLRGDDDPDARSSGRGGGSKPQGLRSPLLGGDDDTPKRGGFPHRSQPMDHDPEEEHNAKPAKGGLRSPLLGGSSDDDYEPRRSNQPRQGEPSGVRRRMHSPLIDGTGDYYQQDHYEEESDYDENDPNVLRSPLLAARQKLHEPKPQAPAAPPPDQQFARDRGFAEPRPAQPEFRDRGFSDPASSLTPPAPTAQPDYFQPAQPDYSQQTYNSQPAVEPSWGDSIPAPQAISAPQSYAEPQSYSAPQSYSEPQSVPPPEPPPVSRKGRSAMLPPTEHNENRVPLSIYDSGLRDVVPGQSANRGGPSLILIVPAVLALIIKLKYTFDLISLIQQKAPVMPFMLINEIGTAAVLVGIIIFGLTAGKK
jgi:hypothetical protein